MTPEQIEQERAAFEAWYRRWAGEEPSVLVDIEGELQYKSTADHQLFSTWLARAEQGGWISVEDRLPETYEEVLVAWSDGDFGFAERINNEIGTQIWGATLSQAVITHWQPLPQPPAGDPT